MDLVRRNTDYALRAMLSLVSHHGNEPVSSREVAQQCQIPYQLTCKLMQKLHNARLVESCMGPKGGFRLRHEPSKISVLAVIEAVQGPLRLNRCLLGADACPRQPDCPVSKRLAELQKHIRGYLGSITLDELSRSRSMKGKGRSKIPKPKRRKK